jgi:hypothetical protein
MEPFSNPVFSRARSVEAILKFSTHGALKFPVVGSLVETRLSDFIYSTFKGYNLTFKHDTKDLLMSRTRCLEYLQMPDFSDLLLKVPIPAAKIAVSN